MIIKKSRYGQENWQFYYSSKENNFPSKNEQIHSFYQKGWSKKNKDKKELAIEVNCMEKTKYY